MPRRKSARASGNTSCANSSRRSSRNWAKARTTTAPKIAAKLVPTLVGYGALHGLELPFKDVDSLVAVIKTESVERLGLAGVFASHALRQTAFMLIGMVVAISLYHNAAIVIDRDKYALKNNLYSLSADEVAKRFELFYRSFHTVMGAQIIISFINAGFTSVFLITAGFPYWGLLIVVTFLCGLLPILGNIISNIKSSRNSKHNIMCSPLAHFLQVLVN